ncbi:hypothetical protein GE09DRAFT_1196605 [Coniochaeta sp. 2T2.1]|nr:hypothetical protein GE09DRAFT_1196605 [Coniochaeta sp. 2T2.1]
MCARRVWIFLILLVFVVVILVRAVGLVCQVIPVLRKLVILIFILNLGLLPSVSPLFILFTLNFFALNFLALNFLALNFLALNFALDTPSLFALDTLLTLTLFTLNLFALLAPDILTLNALFNFSSFLVPNFLALGNLLTRNELFTFSSFFTLGSLLTLNVFLALNALSALFTFSAIFPFGAIFPFSRFFAFDVLFTFDIFLILSRFFALGALLTSFIFALKSLAITLGSLIIHPLTLSSLPLDSLTFTSLIFTLNRSPLALPTFFNTGVLFASLIHLLSFTLNILLLITPAVFLLGAVQCCRCVSRILPLVRIFRGLLQPIYNVAFGIEDVARLFVYIVPIWQGVFRVAISRPTRRLAMFSHLLARGCCFAPFQDCRVERGEWRVASGTKERVDEDREETLERDAQRSIVFCLLARKSGLLASNHGETSEPKVINPLG